MVSLAYSEHYLVGVCNEFRSPSAYWPATAIRYCADQTPEIVWPRSPADESQDHSRALQACISPASRNWRQRPGRPRHTWLRTVEEDLRQFNLGLASGLRRAQNKTDQLGGHSQEQQRHRQAPIDESIILLTLLTYLLLTTSFMTMSLAGSDVVLKAKPWPRGGPISLAVALTSGPLALASWGPGLALENCIDDFLASIFTQEIINRYHAVKSLGVTVDSTLSFGQHVNNICKAAHYHVRALHHIRRYVSVDDAKAVATALASLRLDYCNSVLSGTSPSNLNSLQWVRNDVARTFMTTSKREHISPVLVELHWLPVAARIDFKIAVITFNAYIYIYIQFCHLCCSSVNMVTPVLNQSSGK